MKLKNKFLIRLKTELIKNLDNTKKKYAIPSNNKYEIKKEYHLILKRT